MPDSAIVKPNFLGIGAAKAGTTTMTNMLAQHPEISFPVKIGKELHFFDYPEKVTPEGVADYFTHFEENTATGEFTPSYLFDTGCRDLIDKVLGRDIRFLVTLRNPVDRAFSHYCHAVNNWAEEQWQKLNYPIEDLSFEEAIEKEEERLQSGRYHIRHQSYFSKGLYARQLKWYFEVFPKENFFIYLLEDYTADPKPILTEICRFLGVDDNFEFENLDLKMNAQTNIALSPETRARLMERYRSSIDELEAILGRDLSLWR